jgi:hypothetical protein
VLIVNRVAGGVRELASKPTASSDPLLCVRQMASWLANPPLIVSAVIVIMAKIINTAKLVSGTYAGKATVYR